MSHFRPGQEEVGLLITDAARPQQIPGTEKCFPLWQAVFGLFGIFDIQLQAKITFIVLDLQQRVDRGFSSGNWSVCSMLMINERV